MNCDTFHDLLQEYLDETLDANVQAAAHQHLAQCDNCRGACLREQSLAKFMEQSLERATAGLSVRPGIQQNVLRTLEWESTPFSGWRRAWQSLTSIAIRPMGTVAALLVVLLFVVGIHLYRQAVKDTTFRATAQNGQHNYVIDIPMRTQTHVFRRQDSTIEDSLASSLSVGHANLFEDRAQPSPPSSSNPL
jgi:predicted anti-sigma-YlaC factor YlaD